MAKNRALANLAGLAALGTVAYKLANRDKADSAYPDESLRGRMATTADSEEDVYPDESRRGRMTMPPEQLAPSKVRSAVPTRSAAPTRAVPASSDEYSDESRRGRMATDAAVNTGSRIGGIGMDKYVPRRPLPTNAGGGRGGQGDPTAEELEAYRSRSVPQSSRGAPSRQDLINQIPTSGYGDVSGGERVTGNEVTRNINNILNAPVPGMVPMGRAVAVGKAAAGKTPAKEAFDRAVMADRLSVDRGAVMRAEKEAERANKVRNPMAWMSGPKGMEDFKKGGKVKKMASGGMTSKPSSASKRADGIASKGKTRCKMY